MDTWAAILAGACLGTFILEVWGFWKIIKLIEEIKAGLGFKEGKQFQPGDMLADGAVSMIERLSEDSKRGERARTAFAGFIVWSTDIMKQKLLEGTPGEGMDMKKLPKQAKGLIGIVQTLDSVGLLDGIKKAASKGAGKAIEKKIEGGW